MINIWRLEIYLSHLFMRELEIFLWVRKLTWSNNVRLDVENIAIGIGLKDNTYSKSQLLFSGGFPIPSNYLNPSKISKDIFKLLRVY